MAGFIPFHDDCHTNRHTHSQRMEKRQSHGLQTNERTYTHMRARKDAKYTSEGPGVFNVLSLYLKSSVILITCNVCSKSIILWTEQETEKAPVGGNKKG